MKSDRGPFPSPGFKKQLAANEVAQLQMVFSGEITANINDQPIGAVSVPGRISDVWFSLRDCGRDDTDDLSLEIDVMIDDTSCLSTSPIIEANDGSASEQKTTHGTGTGITQAVIDTDNRDVAVGDVISFDAALTRTTPDTEMANLAIVVELEPY